MNEENPGTPEEAFRETVKNLKSELTRLLTDRERIDKRILAVRQVLAGLDALIDDEEAAIEESKLNAVDSDLGITNSIREILRANFPNSLNARAVRDELLKIKPSFGNLKNPLAIAHTILKRLNPKEVAATIVDGKTTYSYSHSETLSKTDLLHMTANGPVGPSGDLTGPTMASAKPKSFKPVPSNLLISEPVPFEGMNEQTKKEGKKK